MKKILLIHNVISPYRLPLFQELSNMYDLKVLFCKVKDKDRMWDTSLQGYSFEYEIMGELGVLPLIINYSLLFYLIKNKFDVVIIANPTEAMFTVMVTFLYAKMIRKPVILWDGKTDREVYFLINLKNSINVVAKAIYLSTKFIVQIYHRFIYKITDNFVGYGARTKRYLEEFGVNGDKIFIGTQIMPKQLLVKPNIQKSYTEYRNTNVILYIGYLNKRKGVDLLINAFIRAKLRRTNLLIIGSGEEKSELEKLSRVSKVISFIDNVGPQERANYYSLADIFVLPTKHDVWGLVVNEALYYNLPVIVTNEAASSELIKNGKTGFIIDRDYKKLSLLLREYFNNQVLQNKIKYNVKTLNKGNLVDTGKAVDTFNLAITNSLRI